MKLPIFTITFSVLSVSTIYAQDVTNQEYQEAEKLMYARNNQLSNHANYYSFGVQKMCELYQRCKRNPAPDSTPCAQVTLALAKAFYEQLPLIKEEGNGHHYEYPLRKKSFELFEEVTTRYPACNNANVLAKATFYQADNARFGFTKKIDFAQAVHLYQSVVNNPLVTDTSLIAWAQGRLGDSYRVGEGVEKDVVKSVQCFQSIIDNEKHIPDRSIVAWAEYWVADAYQHGAGREKDTSKATAIFTAMLTTYEKTDPVAVIYARERLEKLKQQS